MAEIRVLSSETVDRIAAGEVVERPASIVKELIENAIDAGATAITVEIRDGGLSYIRVSDNGHGIPMDQMRNAFLPHATSKISDAEDLDRLHTLGFRGEALSSIAAVSCTEMISCVPDAVSGSRILIEGSEVKELKEVGAPAGTTVIVRDLFYNVPARKKFVNSKQTEGSKIADLMEQLALSRTDISMEFIAGKQLKLSTTGSGDIKQTVYRLYGDEMAKGLIPFQAEGDGFEVSGVLGNPTLCRTSRSCEFFFLNGRLVKDSMLSFAVEEGYQTYLMQHRYPFLVLYFTMDPARVDVNVHPSKKEVRFSDPVSIQSILPGAIVKALRQAELLKSISTPSESVVSTENHAEPFSKARREFMDSPQEDTNTVVTETYEIKENEEESFLLFDDTEESAETDSQADTGTGFDWPHSSTASFSEVKEENRNYEPTLPRITSEKPKQMNLFEDRILTAPHLPEFQIIGQVFDTYWIVLYQDKMLMIDQHAAHEKVKYEHLVKQIRQAEVVSQGIMPPLVITLSASEMMIYEKYRDKIEAVGFESAPFGGRDISVTAAPAELFGTSIRELFLEILNSLSLTGTASSESVTDRIATMACKAAVKGNRAMSVAEMEVLLKDLLALENPYFCPHGRPAVISFDKRELEKMFKRIV